MFPAKSVVLCQEGCKVKVKGEEPNADQNVRRGKKQGFWGVNREKSQVQKQGQNQVIRQTRAIQNQSRQEHSPRSKLGKQTTKD